MAHMSRQPVVPGANDNLTGVAVLLEVARHLGGEAPDGLRIVLLSTGSEEANQDGMLAFAERHFGELDRERTTFLCLDTVGSPELVLIEGEGFLRMRDYDAATKDLVEGAARGRGRPPAPRAALHASPPTRSSPLRRASASAGSARSTSGRCPPTTTGRPTRPTTSTPLGAPTPSRVGRSRVVDRLSRRAEQPLRELDRLVGRRDLAGVLGLRELAQQRAQRRPRVDAEPPCELVAAQQRRGGAAAARQASAAGSTSRASSRWRAIASSALRPRVASRSATESSVTSTSTGSVAVR